MSTRNLSCQTDLRIWTLCESTPDHINQKDQKPASRQNSAQSLDQFTKWIIHHVL